MIPLRGESKRSNIMGKLSTFLNRAPKRLSALFAILAVAAIVPATLYAWGPNRPTFTIEQPADHVTFNSITNNPNIGDERNFVGIRESGTNSQWTDNMNVQNGKEYTVRVYVHNNAAANLNKVAENVTAKVNLPTTTGKSIQVDGQISSTNASPTEVWDQANFKSAEDFNLAYVAGSLKYENNAFGAAGTPISESVFTNTGAKLGYDKLDGKIPGCFQYAGYLTFKVKPQFAPKNEFTMSKQVRKTGESGWKESVAVKPGDKVDYLVSYKNTGETRQNGVHVSDRLPNGMTYVNGTTKLANPSNPNGVTTNDGVTVGNGLNIGDYQSGSNAFLIFTAQVKNKAELACGKLTLKNVARVTADGGYKEDAADVTVDNDECKPNECKPGIPMGDERCEETPVTPVTPVTPSTPSELPTTGPVETLVSVLGLGSLIAGASYYFVSRRALLGR